MVCAHAVVDVGAAQDGGTYWDCKRCMGDPPPRVQCGPIFSFSHVTIDMI